MTKRLSISMFVDACGWEVIRSRPWFLNDLTYRRRVKSVFGYSSACVPAILTGKLPNENGHWSTFFYSPATSPFRPLRALGALPSSIVDRGRIRSALSKALAKGYGYTGYFQIYNIPFDTLQRFDYTEKRDIFQPGGISDSESIFDYLTERSIRYHVSDWRCPDDHNFDSLRRAICSGRTQFAFMYTAHLDAVLHDFGKESPQVDKLLGAYHTKVQDILRLAEGHYDEVRFALFSDHGMCTVTRLVNLMPRIEQSGMKVGIDYTAIFDSTMLRFWFHTPRAEHQIRTILSDGNDGSWVTEADHRREGTYWGDSRFGNGIYLLNPGVLLCPSHMGTKPLAGMHGYSTEHADSYSSLICNYTPDVEASSITDYYRLMREQADWAASSETETNIPTVVPLRDYRKVSLPR